jgi:hypothetical protein
MQLRYLTLFLIQGPLLQKLLKNAFIKINSIYHKAELYDHLSNLEQNGRS